MLLRSLKAVNFLDLREVDLRNLPRRGVIGLEVTRPGLATVFREALRFGFFGHPGRPGEAIRPGASFTYVDIEFLHHDAGAVSLFRGTDQGGTVQASLREPDRRVIRNGARDVDRRLADLLPMSREEFGGTYLSADLAPGPGSPPETGPLPPETEPSPPEPGPHSAGDDRVERDLLAQILTRPPESRTTLLLAVLFSVLAVLLFGLLFAARRAFGIDSKWASAAQIVVGLLVVFDVWLALRVWRRLDEPWTPRDAVVPAPPEPAPGPEPEPEPSRPAPRPAGGTFGLVTADSVRAAGSRGPPGEPRFLLLAGRWPGDADELLRCAGPAVSQVILLSGPGEIPPGADLRLSVEDAGGEGCRVVAVV